jgi:hypothetical protein
MAAFKKGASGDDVARIQKALKDAGLYEGETNGVFDDGTETGVKGFQTRNGLAADGIVGPQTWARLFPSAISVDKGGLSSRCLALTGSFETGQLAPDCFAAIAGNFDGQGMSFGALQWNFGQGTLQPLLQEMFDSCHDIALKIFGDDLEPLQKAIKGGKESSIAFAVSIQDQGKKMLNTHWRQMFRFLGLTPEFQAIETKGAAVYHDKAVRLCKDYALWSERGLALMFDIAVQNGSISETVKGLILNDVGKLGQLAPEDMETEKMRIVANRRAEAANPDFIEDVRKRKLCIAEGKGVVHGIAYDLAVQFGLDLRKTQLF